MRLSCILQDRNNGLTQSRVLLALLVLLDHQYVLFQIPKPALLSGALTPSGFAVNMFIFMSGLLCYISRSRNGIPRFLMLRIVRIFPGYVACLALSSIVFIPLLAHLSMDVTSDTYRPFLGTLKASVHYFLGNIAFTQNLYLPPSLHIDNPFPAINGSLWTLQPEIMGYILIAILYPLINLRPRPFAVLLILGATTLALLPDLMRDFIRTLLGGYGFETATNSHLSLAVYLLSGIIYSVYACKIDINKRMVAIFLIILAISLSLDVRLFQIISPIILPYVFIGCCWFIRWPWGAKADWSYGVYLYSFPLQQIAWSLQHNNLITNNYWVLLGLVSVVAIVFGAISYYLVEHPSRLGILRMSESVISKQA